MDFFSVYNQHIEQSLFGRYFLPATVYDCLDRYSFLKDKTALGNSEENRHIYGYRFGTGTTKVLIWSQMHGNETTTTKALVDLCSVIEHDKTFREFVLNTYEVLFIPVLNPDGAVAYTRENARGVDLNRDAKTLSQKESKILFDVFSAFQPHLCLNMHDQRTIFSAGNSPNPATVSFLAPAADTKKSITPARQHAMALIVLMRDALEQHIPAQIGRYSDDFNDNCFGDTFQSCGVPVILFESGHFQGDYQREVTRKYICFALWNLFLFAGNVDKNVNYKNYFSIPENQEKFRDIIIYNTPLAKSGVSQDIAIQYCETLDKHQIKFKPVIDFIGDCGHFYAHKAIDTANKDVLLMDTPTCRVGQEIGNIVIDGKKVAL